MAMLRTPEPELMLEPAQAKAYAEADFNKSHSNILIKFDELFPYTEITGGILDLGCGPGDITFRFARRFPEAQLLGVDGSPSMLEFAAERKRREKAVAPRIEFIKSFIPDDKIPRQPYAAIVSGSFLHHLHNPQVLWQTIKHYATKGTIIFIADLCRPESEVVARKIVKENSGQEPPVLQEDYFNSLMAAFTPEEIQQQLIEAELFQLHVHLDGNLYVYGQM